MPAGDYHLLQQLYNSQMISFDTLQESLFPDEPYVEPEPEPEPDFRCLSCFGKLSVTEWYSNNKCKNCGQPINPAIITDGTYTNNTLQIDFTSLQKSIDQIKDIEPKPKPKPKIIEGREVNRFTDFLKDE